MGSQMYGMTNTEYVKFFTMLVGIVETYGVAHGREPWLVMTCLTEIKIHQPTINVDNPDKADLKAAYITCREQYLACMLLCGACQARYGQLKNDLANNMTKGPDNYPKSIIDATRMINEYKGAIRVHPIRDSNGNGLAFVQGGSSGCRKPKGAK